MSFSFPAALWALPAAGLPLVIHWLSRRAAKPVVFPDLSLLAHIEARSRPRSRLRELLLLLARTLLILALILAAAGPTARGDARAAAAASDGLDLVMLLDASYSMRARDAGTTRFQDARDAGVRLLERLSPGDRVALCVFDEKLWSPLEWTTPARAKEALGRASAGLRGTDAGAALTAARDLLARSPAGRRRAAVVLGDGAAHMLAGPAPSPADGESVVGLGFPPLANAWAAGVTALPGGRLPRVEVRAGASGESAKTAVDLWVGERRAASAPLTVPAGGEARAVLSLPPPADPRAPAWDGKAVLRADALPDDDAAYFAVRRPAAPRALVLHGDPDFDRAGRAGWFLRRWFGGGEASLAGREADFLAAARWSEADLSRYGAVVLADAARLPPGLSAALERFVSAGGGLWVIPGASADPAALAPLSAWLPARFGAAETPSAEYGVKALKTGPETAGWDELALSKVAFGRRFRLEPGPQAAVWAAGADGAPLLAAGGVGRGRAVVQAVPLDADWTNLGLKPLFVPWAAACLALTQPPSAGEAPPPARVGQSLVKTWAPDEPAPDRVVVRSPDGRRTTLEVRARRAELPSADVPGLYEFAEPSGATTVFAVDLDASRGESDLTPAKSPPWAVAAPDDLPERFFAEAYGKDRRGWCLGLAALAIALEMLLSLPARRAAGAAARPAAAVAALGLLLLAVPARAQQGDRFVWTQLKLGATWDPYPDAPDRVLAWLGEVTSARVAPARRVAALSDPALFSSPFLYLAGREAPPALSDAELRRLRQFLAGGGFLWIEDSTGGPPGTFDAWARQTAAELLPEAKLEPLPSDHVIYRTFFLLRGPAGRAAVSGAAEGATSGGRVAVLYTRDDALGAWARDALGRPLLACVPGGEAQRERARRLTLNVLMYSMTGSYKADAVHAAAILEKLKAVPSP